MEERTKRKAEKHSQCEGKKHVRFSPVNNDPKETLTAEENECVKKDVHTNEKDVTLQRVAVNVNSKHSGTKRLLSKEEKTIIALTYGYKNIDELTDELGDGWLDELTGDFSDDKYEPKHYQRRESSTDSDSSLYSTNYTDDGIIPPPFMPYYNQYGVSLCNPYEGLDLPIYILPPFSNHMRKTAHPDQNIRPTQFKFDPNHFVEREADMISLVNQPFIIAARKLSDAVSKVKRSKK